MLLFKPAPAAAVASWAPCLLSRASLSFCPSPPFSLCAHLRPLHLLHRRPLHASPSIFASAAFNYSTPQTDSDANAKRALVSKRLESAANYFRRLGTLGFWSQLVCTVVSAVILTFSVAISGTPTSQATFYLAAGGITAAFLSVFWSFGYIRLSERLRKTIYELSKAPPRAEVVNKLKNGLIINILGMGLTLLGMQATVGALVAKSLMSTPGTYVQGAPAGYSPVLALDVFLVQASTNTVLSHFLGFVFSAELLRSVTLSQFPDNMNPKPT